MKNKPRRKKTGANPKTSESMLTQTLSPTEMVTNKIRVLRRNREYSQEYMAFMLHISQNAYSRLENGKTPLTIDRLCEICGILQASPAELMDKIEFPKPDGDVWRRSSY
jgi:transcriptional regulator with XRE-family HTH domain